MKRIDTNLSGFISTLVTVFLLCFATLLYGQRQPYSSSEFIRNAAIQMDKDGISPTFIKFQEGFQPTVFTFLNEYKKSFSAFSGDDNELRLAQTFEDKLGEKHYRFDQYYKGIKVEGAQFILHEKNGFIKAANGQLVHGLAANISPRLSENAALNNAVRHIGAEKYMWDSKSNEEFIKHEQKNSNATFYPKGELILTSGTEELVGKNIQLVYRFDIYAEKPLGRYFVDVDAQNGEIVSKIDRIQHTDVTGSGASLYNGTVSITVDEVTAGSSYRLQEHTTRNAAIESYNMQNGTDYNLAVDFTAASAIGVWDQTGVNTHWGAEATYDYYFNNHSRNSFDNAGSTIFSYAHYGTNYNNAYWDGARMTYGDGDGVNFTSFACIDVVGHEITHGVTQHSANLIYLGESGALNESFSDIFGNEVEFIQEGVPGVGTGSWRCGEDMTPSGLGIRNMQNPNEFNDPDTYLGTNWVTTGSGDNGGVHTNSGVQNFWFYLLCEGGSGTNDHGNAYSVSALGFTKAAAISYRNLTVYLTPSSNYYAARVGSINSAIDLYGAGSAEVQAVMDAWYAVGVYEPVPPSGILVWEGVLGGGDYSGAFINTFLTNAGFTTHYTNVFPPTLIGYDAVFLSFGNHSNQSTRFEDWMATIVKTYLETGGKVYLESGEALGYDQASNTALLNLFGLTSASDGATNVIDGLAGQSGAITNGMLFTSSTQVSNTYIDIFSPSTGAVAFIESSYGNVAVQNIGGYGQKTFCFSYALAELVDGTAPSTKNDLLAGITNFLLSAVPSFVTLEKPNGNEIWKVGSLKKIEWNKYLVDNVKLEYTTDNGVSWIEIISSLPASAGEYDWTIPNTPSDQCKVKISDVLNSAVSDESNNVFAIVPFYFTHTIETFDNAVGTFFPDPPTLNVNYWKNGPTAFLNLSNDADHYEGTGSTRADYRVEAYDDWGGYVVRSTYNPSNAMALPDIDLSAGDNLRLWYKILSPVSLSQAGTVYFEFKLAEYNDFGQRDLWMHRTSMNLSDISSSWLEVTLPLIQDADPAFGFSPQFIEGDGILQLDKIKGFEIAISYFTAGGPTNSPTAIGTFLIDNLQLVYSGTLSLISPNGGEIWKVGLNYDIKWNSSGVDNIDVAYSTDNGSNWNPIVSNYATSSGKYTWTIPNAPSSQCKIKITKNGNGVSDQSNGVFEIKAAGVTAEVEPNNTANEAMNVGIIDEIEGTISPDNDIDYFKFTGCAGDIVQIYGEERNGSGLYGLIMLFDQNGNNLQNNSYFNNTQTKQRIVYELLNSGIYYVRYSNNNNGGNYPNLAAKGNGHEIEKNRLAKPNKETQDVNAPFALSGEYRLTINYFEPSAPIFNYSYTTDVNYNSTRFGGSIYPNGLETSINIEWGETIAYGNTLLVTSNANGLNEYYFTSDKVPGLTPSTSYYYKVTLQNSLGTATSGDLNFSTPSAPINWVHQSSNTSNSLRGVDFIDQNNGFIAGYNKSILKTTDGGTTWTNVCPQNLWFYGNCIDVININKIAAAGNSLLISEDGGSAWSQQQVGNYWLNGISFTDVNNGVVVNENGEIYKTTDGGISWALLTDPISTSLLTVLMLDANTIFAVSSDGRVIKSTDGGLNWASQQLGNWCCSWWAGISFADVNNGMITSMNTFLIYKTTDGGNTWTTLSPPNNFPAVTMIDANNSLAAGFSIVRTQNGGTTWTEEETGSANLLFRIKAISYDQVWAVGEWGTILHSEICDPGWTPVQNQQYNMNIIAELYFDDQLSLNEQDIVGAFVGNECRGVVSPNASLNGKIFLTVTSDQQSGETITFKAWKSGNCQESLILETITFESQGEVGTLGNPFIFHAGAVEFAYNFGTGYTWFSVNANPGDWNVNTVFAGLNPSDNDRIIGQTNFAVYYAAGSQWVGSLNTIDPKKMYIMKLTNGQTFNLTGLPVNPQLNPISLGAGYTWLGYLPSSANPTNTALQNLSPGATDNDRLIGQTSFAAYYAAGSQWLGSLTNMEPTKGYKIKVANNNTLTYPSNSSLFINLTERVAKTQSPPVWTPVQGQQYTMSIIGEIVWNNQVSTNSNDIIGAFVGTECRGVANPTGLIPFPNLFYLTVTSNQQSGEQVTFKVYHAGLDQVDENPSYPVVTFENLSDLGTFSNPFTVTSPLPVELTSFTANVNNNIVNLKWETATEVNNYGFEIERSLTPSASGGLSKGEGLCQWKKIGFVQGSGNSNSPKSYSYVDKNLFGGSKFQYRLKQIDADGKYTYSDVVEVEVVPTEYALYQNYPNPFNPTTSIRFSLPVQSKVILKVYDLIGNEITTLVNEEKPAGNFEVEFNASLVNSGLSSGVYLYKIHAGDFISTKKLILLK
jgi:Zn-dependent metalloprotease/photosystem II stability/assembly factor-like uncharacterized protein